jgi:hypothetical protein
MTGEVRKYSTVFIDRERYIPATERPVDDEARQLLSEVYGALWTEAYYDPASQATRAFAKPLADKMRMWWR